MAKRVPHIGHATAAANLFQGLDREVTVELTKKTLRVHDGVTLGGFELARADLSNVNDATISAAGKMTAAQVTKLDGIDSNAKDDQTGAEIKALYEAEANTNAFTDAEQTKLAGVEAGAAADQTKVDIDALGINAATVSGISAASLLSRVNHTGTQSVTTIIGLGALATKNTIDNSDWGTVDLTVPNGGTARSSLAKGSVLVGNDGGAVGLIAPSTIDHAFLSNGPGVNPSFRALGVASGDFKVFKLSFTTTTGIYSTTISTALTGNFAWGFVGADRSDAGVFAWEAAGLDSNGNLKSAGYRPDTTARANPGAGTPPSTTGQIDIFFRGIEGDNRTWTLLVWARKDFT